MALFSRRRRSDQASAGSAAGAVWSGETAADAADTAEPASPEAEPAAAAPASTRPAAAPASTRPAAAPASTRPAAAPASTRPAASGDATERGPWDVADRDDLTGRVDLGALRVPGRDGMALRMELDRATKRVIAANVTIGQSTIQLQAFAAPRSAGIWDDIRGQISGSIQAQGGAVQEATGPFGKELLALLPVRDAAGKVGRRPARFLGVDGPRWFLRGVVTGAALVDKAAAALIEDYFSEIVVVRGTDPRPPSELLALTMPGRPAPAPSAPTQGEDILTRGPEITEVR